jgi:MFS family permease
MLSLFLPGNKQKTTVTAKSSSAEFARVARGLLARKGLLVSYSCIMAQYFTFGGVVTLLPLYVRSLGMEAFHVGMLLATFAVMFIVVQLPSGAFSDRVGRLIPAVLGLLLGIASLVILPAVVIFPLMAVVMALYGMAYGLLFPSISALIADHTTSRERGMATGVFHALLTVGVAVGAPVMGWVGEIVGVELGLVLTPGVLVFALIVVLRFSKQI